MYGDISKNHDDIRQNSGFYLPRKDMAINMDNKCLSHQTNGRDKDTTIKMFKMACLAYQPSKINYRDLVIDRTSMIRLRRALVD
jgi:hypothetical protein